MIGWLGGCSISPTQPQPRDKRVAQKLSDMKHILPQIAPEAPPLNQYFAEELLHRQQGKSGFYPLAAPMDALAARLFLIDHAQDSLDVQYYLYHDDLSGSLVARHLVQAADRGVKVRMLLDDLDAANKDPVLAMIAQHPNIHVRLFNPIYFRNLLRNLSLVFNLDKLGRRMHNKSLIADGQVAIIGGRNIGDVYFAADDERLFLDFDVMTVGPVAHEVTEQFNVYWQSDWAKPVSRLAKYHFRFEDYEKLYEAHEEKMAAFAESPTARRLSDSRFNQQIRHHTLGESLPVYEAEAEFFYDPPKKVAAQMSEQESINAQLEDILKVEKELIMISPYFIPTESGMARLQALRDKGVEIIIVTNSLASTDVVAVYSGYKSYREGLLKMGVTLYELRPQASRKHKPFQKHWRQNQLSLHTKLTLIDGRYLLTGSANIDPRSIRLNTELMVLIDDVDFTQHEREQLLKVLSEENVYRLAWETLPEIERSNEFESEGLVWHYRDNGEDKQVYATPEAGFWRKFGVDVLSILPIEGYL